MSFVAYFRARPSEPEASERALKTQYRNVYHDPRDAQRIIAAFTECEDEVDDRPALAAALQLCEAKRATLLIASIEPIGSGRRFDRSGIRCPVKIILHTIEEPSTVIPLPSDAPEGLSFHAVRHGDESVVPVYLCNSSTTAYASVALATTRVFRGNSYDREERKIGELNGTTCILALCYDPYFGDTPILYEFELYERSGQHYRAEIFLCSEPGRCSEHPLQLEKM